MAPVWTPTRVDVIAQLRAQGDAALPALFGHGEYEAVITKDADGAFRMRLVELLDEEAMNLDRERAFAAKQPWMPEHAARFYGPKTVTLDVTTLSALIAALESMTWTSSPRE